MIQRIVVIRFKPEFRTPGSVREIAEHSRKVMPTVAGVQTVTVGSPADDRTAKQWDLVLVVGLENLDDLPAYGSDPAHRAYVDEYLRPKMDSIAAWNFEIP